MLTTPADIYAFGPFLLDRRRRRLEKNGVAVGLRPKVFDLLVALIEQAGHDVDKEERRVPPDVVDVLIEYVRRKPSPFTIVALQNSTAPPPGLPLTKRRSLIAAIGSTASFSRSGPALPTAMPTSHGQGSYGGLLSRTSTRPCM